MKFEKQTYTQIPNSLFGIMKDMDECELKVVMLICRFTFGYHRDEIKLSTRQIAEQIGMNTASVQKGADRAVERGLIEKVVDGHKTTLWRALVADSNSDTDVIQKLIQTDSSSESQLGVKESIKESINKQEKKVLTSKEIGQATALANAMISQGSSPLELLERSACEAFESAFGITRPWNWHPAKTSEEVVWKSFRAFLVELYEADKNCFTKYFTWTQQPFVRGAMTALGIKRNPQDFPDSWSAYCASEMYTKPVKHKSYNPAEDVHPEYVPAPEWMRRKAGLE